MRLREGKLISEWKDEYGNKALIEEVEVKPHKEAKTEKLYKLSCYAEYDNDFCYYISIFDIDLFIYVWYIITMVNINKSQGKGECTNEKIYHCY